MFLCGDDPAKWIMLRRTGTTFAEEEEDNDDDGGASKDGSTSAPIGVGDRCGTVRIRVDVGVMLSVVDKRSSHNARIELANVSGTQCSARGDSSIKQEDAEIGEGEDVISGTDDTGGIVGIVGIVGIADIEVVGHVCTEDTDGLGGISGILQMMKSMISKCAKVGSHLSDPPRIRFFFVGYTSIFGSHTTNKGRTPYLRHFILDKSSVVPSSSNPITTSILQAIPCT